MISAADSSTSDPSLLEEWGTIIGVVLRHTRHRSVALWDGRGTSLPGWPIEGGLSREDGEMAFSPPEPRAQVRFLPGAPPHKRA